MRPRLPKTQILEDAGYAYSFERLMYINRKVKKGFSVEFVQDHSEEQLQAAIREPTDGNGWRFYFNEGPSPGVQHELERVLG